MLPLSQLKKQITQNAGENVGEREHLHTASGNINYYSQYGYQFGCPSKIKNWVQAGRTDFSSHKPHKISECTSAQNPFNTTGLIHIWSHGDYGIMQKTCTDLSHIWSHYWDENVDNGYVSLFEWESSHNIHRLIFLDTWSYSQSCSQL